MRNYPLEKSKNPTDFFSNEETQRWSALTILAHPKYNHNIVSIKPQKPRDGLLANIKDEII